VGGIVTLTDPAPLGHDAVVGNPANAGTDPKSQVVASFTLALIAIVPPAELTDAGVEVNEEMDAGAAARLTLALVTEFPADRDRR